MSKPFQQELAEYQSTLDLFRKQYAEDGTITPDEQSYLDVLEGKIQRVLSAISAQQAGNGNGQPFATPGSFTKNSSNATLADNAGAEQIAGQVLGSGDAIGAGTESVGVDVGGVSVSTPQAAPAKAPVKLKIIRFRFKLTKDMLGMKSEELWEMIIAQYWSERGYPKITRDQVRKLINSNHAVQRSPQALVTQDELGKGYREVLLRVPSDGSEVEDEVTKLEKAYDDFARLFHQLSKEDQRMIEVYMDKLGQPLRKGSAKDQEMIPEWLRIGLELVQQRLAIAALDEAMFRFMMRTTSTPLPLSPALYAKVLEVAAEFQNLGKWGATWENFANQVFESHKDLDHLLRQVRNYGIHLSYSENTKNSRVQAKDDLAGKEKVYAAYKALLAARKHKQLVEKEARGVAVGGGGERSGNLSEADALIARREAEYRQLYTAYGYKAGDFESQIASYEKAFEREAVVVAKDMLDGGERQLLLQQAAVTDEKVNQLFKALGKARAALEKIPDYEFQSLQQGITEGTISWEGNHELSPVVSEVKSLSGTDPLLKDLLAREGPLTFSIVLDLVLARSVDALRKLLSDSITAKRDKIRVTRKYLEKDPRLIWSLDELQKRTKSQSNVESGSTYDSILKDKKDRDAEDEKWNTIKKTVLAVVLGALSFGAGAVAMGAGAIAAGIGFDEGMDALRKYEIKTAAHGAGLLSTDPSFGWVLLAFAGVGLDALGVGAAAKAGAKAAQAARAKRTVELLQDGSPVGDAVRAFNKADDRMAALEQLNKQLAGADAKLQKAIMRAAEAEAKTDSAWKALKQATLGSTKGALGIEGQVAAFAPYFAFFIFRLMRQKILEFDQFIKLRGIVSLIGKIEDLGPDALKALRVHYDKGAGKVREIMKRKAELKLSDEAWEDAAAMWAHNPTMTADDFLRQLPDFAPRTPTKAMGPVYNTGSSKAVPAPKSVMDDSSRRALSGHDGASMTDDIAGTGGIQQIKAVRDADGTIRVTIGGEILPHRLRRSPKIKVIRDGKEVEIEVPLQKGQTDAPNFNNRSEKLGTLTSLGLKEGEWARLHLWGPGFGDEAAAGMFIGPTKMNLVWQNSGIEKRLRQLADRIAPLRPNYKMKVIATAESWGRTTPKGFKLPNGEPLAKSFTYEIIVTTPAGSKRATVKLELRTDPFDIVKGVDPDVKLFADDTILHQLFEALTKS